MGHCDVKQIVYTKAKIQIKTIVNTNQNERIKIPEMGGHCKSAVKQVVIL